MDRPEQLPTPLKVLIAGPFGVGKTTLITAVSEIRTLQTEENLTHASTGIDNLTGIEGKATTTVALDFGRITIRAPHQSRNPRYFLYLYGTPGQERFWFIWDELCIGALGAIVLVDTRRLHEAFNAVDFFENRRVPVLVAANHFDGAHHYPPEEIHTALQLPASTPVVSCDARDRTSVKTVLITFLQHLITSHTPATQRP